MDKRALTLRDLLMPSEGDSVRGVRFGLESSPVVRELQEKLAKQKVMGWPGTLALLAGKIGDLLNIAIAEDIFIKVWNEAELFRMYLDRDRYPATETVAVPLAEHTIQSTHRPYLEVRVNDAVVRRIDFKVDLTVTLKGAILEIQDGKIRKLRTGECGGKIELSCEGLTLASEKFDTKRLPGEKVFKDGIPIAA